MDCCPRPWIVSPVHCRRFVWGLVGTGLFSLAGVGRLPVTAQPATPPATPTPAIDWLQLRRPNLSIGSQGESVAQVQALLKLLGYYPDAVDGLYREGTAAAVAAFQTDAGLAADGIVGPATWMRLLPSRPVRQPQASSSAPMPTPTPTPAPRPAAPTPSPTPAPTPSPTPTSRPAADDGNGPANSSPRPAIVALPTLRLGMQGPAVIQLQERLRQLGTYQGAIDGIFGPGTEAAVIAAQRQAQLNPDGIVGPATWNLLLGIDAAPVPRPR